MRAKRSVRNQASTSETSASKRASSSSICEKKGLMLEGRVNHAERKVEREKEEGEDDDDR